VINVPPPTVIVQAPPATVPALRPAKPAGAARAWSVARVAGPVIASAAALVISVLAYTDQHRADDLQIQEQQADNSAAVRRDAQDVSWYSTPDGKLIVNNGSTGPITSLTLQSGQATFDFGRTLPPCSQVTIDFVGARRRKILSPADADVAEIIFTDRNERTWIIGPSGTLTLSAGDFIALPPSVTSYPTKIIHLATATMSEFVAIHDSRFCS
jgi:hypothetical protein